MLDAIRAATPDLYLSLLLSPASARAPLTALYALEAELLNIPSRVTQPTIGLVRVVWWRDRLAAQDTAQPLLAQIAKQWPDDAAVLAGFADSFSVLFDELPTDAASKIIEARAMLWATLVARVLQVPVPDAYAAAAAHYGLPVRGRAHAAPLKLLMRLAARRAAGQNGWLGDVWTAVRTSVC